MACRLQHNNAFSGYRPSEMEYAYHTRIPISIRIPTTVMHFILAWYARVLLLNSLFLSNHQIRRYQILPSIDIWHLFGLISRIPGLLYGFFLCFSFFPVFSYRFSFRFSFSALGLYLSHNRLFLGFYFSLFSSI